MFNLEQFKNTIKKFPDLKQISDIYLNKYPHNIAGIQRIYFDDLKVSLTLVLDDIKSSLSYLNTLTNIDAWYLDGFSPKKNPDMWSKDIFKGINLASHKNSSFSTYTSARLVKDNIEEAGLVCNLVEGFASKRHMLVGKSLINNPKKFPKKKNIAVIGSGIAGCTLAHKLALRGHKVDIYEQNKEVCLGASGNGVLITYPRLSAFDSPYARFCIHSFLYASSFYDRMQTNAWHKSGVFLMSHDDASIKRQRSLLDARQDNYLFQEFSKEEGSKKANLKLKSGGMYFEKGGFIETKRLCQDLLSHENINLFLSTKIERLDAIGSKKKVHFNAEIRDYEEICLCTGNASSELMNLSGLSSKRGQISYIKSSKDLENLKFPICASGYFSPKIDGTHIVGSTYSDINHDDVILEEHISNLEKLKVIHDYDVDIIRGKAGFRAITKDRMPLLGLKEGIYINTGHGSRGSTSAPLCAEIIADLIESRPLPVEKNVLKALDASRFN